MRMDLVANVESTVVDVLYSSKCAIRKLCVKSRLFYVCVLPAAGGIQTENN
jgi:hypothetical protein